MPMYIKKTCTRMFIAVFFTVAKNWQYNVPKHQNETNCDFTQWNTTHQLKKKKPKPKIYNSGVDSHRHKRVPTV